MHRHFVSTLLVCTLLVLTAVAAPPSLDDLRGTWWDEEGELMFEMKAEGAGTLIQCELQLTLEGQFGMDAPGTLSFAPKGLAARKWTASMDGEFLVLEGTDGRKLRYRRETRSQREQRCLDAYTAWTEAKRAVEVPNAPAGEADRLWSRCEELKISFRTLLGSLAGDGEEAREKLLEELLERASPEAAKAVRDAAREVKCSNGLKQIWIYCVLYEAKTKEWPRNLAALERPDIASDHSLFQCPVTANDNAYTYVVPPKGDQTAPDAVMLYDRDPHPDAKRGVASFGGEVLRLGQEDFERALKEGVDKARPRVEVTSARLVDDSGKRFLVVEGRLSGLKASVRNPGPGTRGRISLEVSGRRKAPFESPPVRLQGAEGSQLPFTLRVDLSLSDGKDLVIWAVVHDDVREADFRTKVDLTK
jgi:hypothetical protein